MLNLQDLVLHPLAVRRNHQIFASYLGFWILAVACAFDVTTTDAPAVSCHHSQDSSHGEVEWRKQQLRSITPTLMHQLGGASFQ